MAELWESELWKLCREHYGEQVSEPVQARLQQEIDMARPYFDDRLFQILTQLSGGLQRKQLYFSLTGMSGCFLSCFLMGLTPVNPLPAHYHCKACHHIEFVDGEKDGYDLPDKVCPVCGQPMRADGHDLSVQWVKRCLQDGRYHRFEFRTSEEAGEAEIRVLRQYPPYTPCYARDGTLVRWLLGDVGPEYLKEFPGSSSDGAKKIGACVEDELPALPAIRFSSDGYRARLAKLAQLTGRDPAEIPLNDQPARDVLRQVILTGGQDAGAFDPDMLGLRSVMRACREDPLRRECIEDWAGTSVTAESLTRMSGLASVQVRQPEQFTHWAAEHFYDRDAALQELVRQTVDEETAAGIADFKVRAGLPQETEGIRQKLDQDLLTALDNTAYLFPRAHYLIWTRIQLQLAWFAAHEPDAFRKVTK